MKQFLFVVPAKAGTQSLDPRPSRFARQYMYGGKAAGRGDDDFLERPMKRYCSIGDWLLEIEAIAMA